jgi:NitT/TauT family transport system substrate-binding protein
MNKYIGFTAILILVLGIGTVWYLNPLAKETGTETTKVRIANWSILEGWPLYLALDKGYFAEVGLDVEVVKFEASNLIIDALLAEQVDFASPTASAVAGIADTKNPGKLKLFYLAGSSREYPANSLLIRADSTIASVAELRGRKLGILPGIQWRTIAEHMLAENNLQPNIDVTIVELAAGLQAQALSAGQIDALLALEPVPSIVRLQGIGKDLVRVPTSAFVSDPLFGGSGIVRAEFAKRNPNTTKKVLEVYRRALKEIYADPEAARKHFKGHTSLSDDLIPKVQIPLIKMYDELTETEIAATQKFFNIFSERNIITGNINLRDLLFSENNQ